MFYETEYPQVYSTSNIKLDILSKPIIWFKPVYSSLGQLILYRFKIKPNELRCSNEAFRKQIIKMQDGTEIMIAINSPSPNPTAVVLYLHTVCGDCTQLAHISEVLKNDNIAYITFTRSGNDKNLHFKKFNFVGNIDELQVVIDYIKYVFPHAPIHAIGASAGSALLIRYLGKYNTRKLIQSAVLVSPGYDFIKAIQKMGAIQRAYLVNKMKFTVKNMESERDISEVSSMSDWVDYQSKILGYATADDYIKECNPVYYLRSINVPSLFLSSLDDNIFDGEITKEFTHLPYINPNINMVLTKRGGHVIFEDYGHSTPWFVRVIKEWVQVMLKIDK